MATPTSSASGLAHRAATFDTTTDALDYAAKGKSGVNFYGADESLVTALTYAEMREKSLALAGKLAAKFPRQSHLGLIADTSADFLVAFMACQYAGMIPAPMSLPAAFSGRANYEWQIAGMARTAALSAIMTPPNLFELLEGIASEQDIPVYELSGADLGDETATPIPHGPDEPAYLQFSSGSTSEPKGILSSQRSLMANAHAITNEGLMLNEHDRMASWLPLYHDMGLVGFFIVPMCNQNSLDYISPSTFARRPGLWLRIMSDNRCTVTYSPSFGYGLAARRHRSADLDLSCVRVAGIGGDMIQHDVLDRFHEVFQEYGFRREAFVASYGMAEVTLAASFAPLNTGPRLDTVNLTELQTRSVANRAEPEADKQRTFTACGRPLPSLEVCIRDQNGNNVAPREIGQVMLKGPSIAEGYFRKGKRLKKLCDADGWFATGDLGYWLDDELVITGRSKDLMLWNGKNIWPQDLEWVAQKAGGKHVSRAVAFDFEQADGTSQVMLLVECRVKDEERRAEIKREITNAVRSVVGVPFEFVFVVMRSLPVTSSGKLSRAGARVRYLDGRLTDARANVDGMMPHRQESRSVNAS
ncbi:MAG: fatty acyl-AMP ligase [Pseudomonadota bacterium]